jgi:hypothetical protein
MKYYKPNNTTLLYLNSSFNCTKASTITLVITTAGTGYTSAPTITITPAAGDMGNGATATCTVSAGGINTITMTNNGMNYNALPTVTITGGGGSGAVLTPSFVRTMTYSWNVPDIVINDLAKLSAINIIATGYNTTTPYTYRINGLQYNSRDSFFSDFGQPILSMAQNVNVCSYGSLGGGEFSILLTPQTIKQIVISVDDSITAKNVGQSSSINFVIALEIIEFNPQYEETSDPYSEGASHLKLNF